MKYLRPKYKIKEFKTYLFVTKKENLSGVFEQISLEILIIKVLEFKFLLPTTNNASLSAKLSVNNLAAINSGQVINLISS